MALAAWLARPLLLLLLATYRVRFDGGERLERALAGEEPSIYACWHSRLFVCTARVVAGLERRGRRLAVLISLSRDGELGARMAETHGLAVVRGSTSRGGLGGLKKLFRAVDREQLSVLAAPDGPRGPAGVAQPGTLLLAKLTGAPVVPLAFAARSAWRLGSWDRMVVPKPFTRVVVSVGEPLAVPASSDDDDLAAAAVELGRRLDALVESAEAAFDR